jgi:alkyl sulfatase BDS1-like metallo-beta-lactamase superfamily hydrolase
VGAILDLAERSWNGDLAESGIGLLAPSFACEEIAPDLFFVQGFANVSALRTPAGLVLVDTGNWLSAGKSFEAVRAHTPDLVHTAVYTHGHVDHAFGLPPFLAEAENRGWPAPRVVGHRNVSARFDRYRRTRGWNACINARQFSAPRALAWPERYDYPDTTYDGSLLLDVGGARLELHHALGETDDHTWIFWPARRALFTGDQFLWVAPNAGNPQKAQRYADAWAASLREMDALGAELLVPGHGPPIFGEARVRQALRDTAEWLESLVAQTLERMNAGAGLDEILHEVKPPAALADRPYLQPVYDDPEYVVRNVYRLYGGWWDGVASHLKPARERELAAEVARLSGGTQALVLRARALADAGEWRLAGHLADWAALAAPESADAQTARAEIYEARARQESALMTKGVFRAAARESREQAGRREDRG